MTGFPMHYDECIQALLSMDEFSVLSSEVLFKIQKIKPNEEELNSCKLFKGDVN